MPIQGGVFEQCIGVMPATFQAAARCLIFWN